MNYNKLLEQIQNYANKNDQKFNDAIPNFIEMGQQRIWRELTGIEFEIHNTTGRFEAINAYVEKPPLWNKTVFFSYGDIFNYSNASHNLKLRTYEFCRNYWPAISSVDDNNLPEFYSDTKNEKGKLCFFISPTPNKSFRYELTYLTRVFPISLNNDTNILTNNYPDLLFYACFLEALNYLRDDERVQIYEANYQRALASAMQTTQDRHMDRTTNREIN